MGGRTSSESKDRWNRNNYDSVLIRIPKGMKEEIREYAEQHGESVNGLINRLLTQEMRKGPGD